MCAFDFNPELLSTVFVFKAKVASFCDQHLELSFTSLKKIHVFIYYLPLCYVLV